VRKRSLGRFCSHKKRLVPEECFDTMLLRLKGNSRFLNRFQIPSLQFSGYVDFFCAANLFRTNCPMTTQAQRVGQMTLLWLHRTVL
jgi:hypothetical protein